MQLFALSEHNNSAIRRVVFDTQPILRLRLLVDLALGSALNLIVNQSARVSELPFNTVTLVGFAFREAREGLATKKYLIVECQDVSPIRRCNYYFKG